MGKVQSKTEPLNTDKRSSVSSQKDADDGSNGPNEDGKEGEDSNTNRKDLIIAFNEDFTQIDVNKEKRGGSTRRMSRMEKLKSRKLPHVMRIQIIEEGDEAEDNCSVHKSSDHHMTHLEKIKRRKMPAGKRIFGDHYVE